MTSSARIACFAITLAALVCVLAAGSAQAATISLGPDSATYTAGPGEANSLYVYELEGKLVFEESKAERVDAPAQCSGGRTRVCPLKASLTIDLGDKGDLVQGVYTYGPATIRLGDGNDKLFAYDNHGPARIEAGPGNDLVTGTGRDGITGIGYQDTIIPGEGADKVSWGYVYGIGGLVGRDTVDLTETKPKSDKVLCEGSDDLVMNLAKQDKTVGCQRQPLHRI